MKIKYLTFVLGVFLLTVSACKSDTPDVPDVDPEDTELMQFYIDLEPGDVIDSKDRYAKADVRIDGKGIFPDYEGTGGIRGRGNSTWQMPKKPYKLKLDSKESLMGLPAYKNWILLNSYLDGTLVLESIGYQMGHLLDIPFTNHVFPVELTLNGKYQGFYVFSEHKEVGEGRIDIGKDGWLLEMDVYYDEPLQFKSAKYNLPVMVKYPKHDKMSESEGQSVLAEIREDFEKLEALIYDSSFPDNDYLDYFDDRAFVDYMLVYMFTLNREINHPKSTYINKPAGGKYRMGIIWDFDWGYGYGGSESAPHFSPESVEWPLLFNEKDFVGGTFFSRLMEDPHNQELFKERWNWFRTNKYQELLKYIDDWATRVESAYENDHKVWGQRSASGDFQEDYAKIKDWLNGRANYMDRYVSQF